MVKRVQRLTSEQKSRIDKKSSKEKQRPRARATHDTDAPAEKKDKYSVGRGKPPKHTQFRKGDGRPRPGRPKGSKNIVTLVMEAARDQVTVAIDGKRRKISKAQAAAIHLANAGATGNEKLLLKFIVVIADIEARAEAARPSEYPFSDTDQIVIRAIYKRLRPYDQRESD